MDNHDPEAVAPATASGPLNAYEAADVRIQRWKYVREQRAKVPPKSYRTLGKELGISHARVKQIADETEPPGLAGWAGHSARNGGGGEGQSSP